MAATGEGKWDVQKSRTPGTHSVRFDFLSGCVHCGGREKLARAKGEKENGVRGQLYTSLISGLALLKVLSYRFGHVPLWYISTPPTVCQKEPLRPAVISTTRA
jgi:hypothetical protein